MCVCVCVNCDSVEGGGVCYSRSRELGQLELGQQFRHLPVGGCEGGIKKWGSGYISKTHPVGFPDEQM